MNNRQILPFERNRYYAGKSLTSADFRAEQNYFNDKRRFLNKMLFGEGIICGLSVFSLDDLSVLVESGAAIDGLGREIVVENAEVRKLSAIRGFEELTGDTACLCLRYLEKDVQPVYAVHGQAGNEEYEYNHISEGYELYLTDVKNIGVSHEPEAEFFIRETLFQTQDYRIEAVMPATVCKGRSVRLKVRVAKLSGEPSELTYRSVLQTPHFYAQDGSHQVEIGVEKLTLAEGATLVKEYLLNAQEEETGNADIVLKSGSAKAEIDHKQIEANREFTMKPVIEDCKPEELAARENGKINLEMKNMAEARDYIHLADLRLARTESAYLIEEIVEKNIKRYLSLPAQDRAKREYLEFFETPPQAHGARRKAENGNREEGRRELSRAPQIATGTLEIPLGSRAAKGGIYYSGEIMHGLGKGNVTVQLGYEYMDRERADGANTRNTVYGSQALFAAQAEGLPDVETAVRVLNDKGSFIAAVRLKAAVNHMVLGFCWTAVRYPMQEDAPGKKEYAGKSIAACTPTVVLGTRESFFFAVSYTNMQECSLAYELTEAGSGEISADGVYTAPGRAGVYEIHIYCVELPVIDTYAYAIVKKKGGEDAEHGL